MNKDILFPPVYADTEEPGVEMSQANINNPLLPSDWNKGEVSFVSRLINLVLSWLLVGAVLFFFFTFILGGIKWITAGGDENKVKAARGQISSSIIGLVVVFLIFAVLKLIGYIFGIESLQELIIQIPTLS